MFLEPFQPGPELNFVSKHIKLDGVCVCVGLFNFLCYSPIQKVGHRF